MRGLGIDSGSGSSIGAGDLVCVLGHASGQPEGSDAGYVFVHAWTVRDGALFAAGGLAVPAAA
jgi:hypothetical protein